MTDESVPPSIRVVACFTNEPAPAPDYGLAANLSDDVLDAFTEQHIQDLYRYLGDLIDGSEVTLEEQRDDLRLALAPLLASSDLRAALDGAERPAKWEDQRVEWNVLNNGEPYLQPWTEDEDEARSYSNDVTGPLVSRTRTRFRFPDYVTDWTEAP